MSNQPTDYYIAHVHRQPLDFIRAVTPDQHAVFRETGALLNHDRAEHLAEQKGGERHYRIEDTQAGRYVAQQRLPESVERQVLDRLQLDMAACARGPVETFVNGAPANSPFRNGTMQAMMQNPDITTINGISRALLQRGSHQEQFAAICAAELMRDRDSGLVRDPVNPGAVYHGERTGDRDAAAAAQRTPPEVVKQVFKIEADLQREKANARRDKQRDREWDRDR